jgi:signal transduction histidine kinase
MNIRYKLSIQFTAIVLSILVLFSSAIYFISANYRKKDFTTRLEEKALTTAKLLIEVKEVDSTLLKIIDKNTLNVLEDEKVLIYDNKNNLIYKNTDSTFRTKDLGLLTNIKSKKKVYFTESKTEYVGIVFSYATKEYIVIASAYDKYGLKELKDLRLILITGLFISFLLTLFAGLYFSDRAMKPILNVIKQVNNISASKLNTRVDEGNGTDEIARLAITFNKMLERLELAFENQRQFVSNVSHELRTPLTSLTGQLEVTLMKKRQTDEYEIILNSLLEDIKTLNSLSNGLLELAHSNIDIHAFKTSNLRIDEILLQSQTDLLKRNNNYIITIDFDELPDDFQKLVVCANDNLLKIAFTNIMDNACKFSEIKEVDIKIAFSTDFIIIKFIDNGIGIPTEELDSIFEPFYRASNSKTKFGHGIGLSLVKKIIELHNGTLKINSKVDIGTQLTISLPY